MQPKVTSRFSLGRLFKRAVLQGLKVLGLIAAYQAASRMKPPVACLFPKPELPPMPLARTVANGAKEKADAAEYFNRHGQRFCWESAGFLRLNKMTMLD